MYYKVCCVITTHFSTVAQINKTDLATRAKPLVGSFVSLARFSKTNRESTESMKGVLR